MAGAASIGVVRGDHLPGAPRLVLPREPADVIVRVAARRPRRGDATSTVPGVRRDRHQAAPASHWGPGLGAALSMQIVRDTRCAAIEPSIASGTRARVRSPRPNTDVPEREARVRASPRSS